jgi:hypothetical protein
MNTTDKEWNNFTLVEDTLKLFEVKSVKLAKYFVILVDLNMCPLAAQQTSNQYSILSRCFLTSLGL